MIELTPKEAGARLALFADEGRLIQGSWHSEVDSRQLACALGSMHRDIRSSSDCPASVMPTWLASMIPGLFDGLAKHEAADWGSRFGKQMQSPEWGDIAWDIVQRDLMIFLIEDAVSSAKPVAEGKVYWPAVESSCQMVVDALRGKGDLEKARAAAAATAAAAARWAATAAAARWAAATAAAATAAAAAAAATAARWADDAAAAAAARKRQADKLCELIDGARGTR